MKVLLLIAACFLAACSVDGPPAPKTELAADARPALGRMDVIVNESQTQIYPERMPSPGLTFSSAVAAGFNSAWLKGRSDRVNAALPTFDYPADVLQATKTAFTRIDRLDIALPADVVRDGRAGTLAAYEASKADAVLFFGITYLLEEQGWIRFDGWVWLLPKSAALKRFRPQPNDANPLDPGNAIYRKVFRFWKNPGSTPAEIHGVFVQGANTVAAKAAAELNTLK
jgi:hypothetical protein